MAHFSRSETRRMEAAAALFRVLGQTRRIAVLRLLDFGPLPTKMVATQLGQPFKDITYDLGQLFDAGAVGRHPGGGGRGGDWFIADLGRALLAAYTLLSHVPREVPSAPDATAGVGGNLESVTSPEED